MREWQVLASAENENAARAKAKRFRTVFPGKRIKALFMLADDTWGVFISPPVNNEEIVQARGALETLGEP